MTQTSPSNTHISMLDLNAQYDTIRDEINEAIQRVLESQYFILGPEVTAFEKAVASYSNANHAVGVSSGTDALLLTLMAMEIKPGDEVITSAYSFFATAGAIARLGATPVFVDIDPQTYNIDVSMIEAKITDRTRALIPVHLFGQVADMSPIMDIAKSHKLIVIEDAAQAIGAEYKGQRAGAIGDMGCLSFFPSKNLGAYGDAGMVLTNSDHWDKQLRLYRNHGYKPKYFSAVVGGNFRLDAIQAAILNVKLKYLDSWTEQRQANADTYRRLFNQAGLDITLEAFNAGETGIVLPYDIPEYRHIYNQFIIRCPRRDQLMAHLKDNHIDSAVYYPCPLHLQECFLDLGYQTGDLPYSEAAAAETLGLPIYPELTESMQTRIVETIAQFYQA